MLTTIDLSSVSSTSPLLCLDSGRYFSCSVAKKFLISSMLKQSADLVLREGTFAWEHNTDVKENQELTEFSILHRRHSVSRHQR